METVRTVAVAYTSGVAAAVSPCVVVLIPLVVFRFTRGGGGGGDGGGRKVVGRELAEFAAGFVAAYVAFGGAVAGALASPVAGGVTMGLGLVFVVKTDKAFL